MLQRPESEKAAVHGMFPDTAPLAADDGRRSLWPREGDGARSTSTPWSRCWGSGARNASSSTSTACCGRACWPRPAAPFAWTPEISGAFSYIGLYFGLHEALLCLKKRGIVLACVSKNDEASVRDLWKYRRALSAPASADAGRFRHLAGQLGRQGRTTSARSPRNWALRWRPSCSSTTIRSSATGCASGCRRWKSGARTCSACAGGCSTIRVCSCPVITAEAAARSTLVKAQIGRQRLRRRERRRGALSSHRCRSECRVERLAPTSDAGAGRGTVPAHHPVQHHRPRSFPPPNWRRWPRNPAPGCLRSMCRIASAITDWSARP